MDNNISKNEKSINILSLRLKSHDKKINLISSGDGIDMFKLQVIVAENKIDRKIIRGKVFPQKYNSIGDEEHPAL
jgi:hypothetical protein